ncbi:MAG: MFS transporter [Candidatus Latescibacteria bacterium]|nr:MFS transporter [Candidatus Latescibacterota bacterium]
MFWLAQMADGASLVLLSGHMGQLGFSGAQISYVFSTTALAALVSPLVAGWLADRYWPSQRLLGACYLIGAPLLLLAWRQTEFWPFWGVMALFALVRLPGRTLTNVVAFYHLDQPERYGYLRVWGTVGWVFVSWCLSLYLHWWEWARMGDALLLAAGLALVTGLYCWTLPHTPPASGQSQGWAFLGAFRLLRQRNFAVLTAIAFVSSAMSPFYYNFSFLFLTEAGGLGLQPSMGNWVQSLGQVAEVVVLLGLAASLRRWGMKRILLLGVGAQALRFAVFSLGQPLWLVVGAVALHGVIFTFLISGLTVAVENLGGGQMRARAQGLMTLVRSGVGALCGNFLAGWMYDSCVLEGGGHDWGTIFLLPACVTGAALVVFGVFFGAGDGRPKD